MSSLVVLVGNPRGGSRTHLAAVAAAEAVGRRIGHETAPEVVDLSAIGPHLFAPGPSPTVEVALELVAGAQVLLVASPTYKATYTGLLKAFLDRLPGGALTGTVALPLLVMGSPGTPWPSSCTCVPCWSSWARSCPLPAWPCWRPRSPTSTGSSPTGRSASSRR